MARQVGYPSDVTDAEWTFVDPYLALIREDAPQRQHSLRALFNAVRYLKPSLPGSSSARSNPAGSTTARAN